MRHTALTATSTPTSSERIRPEPAAFAVVAELGLPLMMAVSEIVPGVPVTCIEAAHLVRVLPGRRRDLFLITKAGGFGERDVLCRVRERLDSHGR